MTRNDFKTHAITSTNNREKNEFSSQVKPLCNANDAKARYAYKNQNREGKRKLTQILFSNLSWEGGNLYYEFKQSFDIIDKMDGMRPGKN